MPLTFRKVKISDESYESAGLFDVSGNGAPDIVSGGWWYEGPEFTKRHFIGEVQAEGEYYDDFSTIPLDINGNGRTDFVTGGWWGNTLRWRENPGDGDAEWPEHVIAETGNIESTRAWDVDGDGVVELVPNTPGGPLVVHKLVTDPDGRGTGAFTQHVLRDEPQGHGLGCGDIAGNGRSDFVLWNGWLEAPERPYEDPWQWHAEFELFKSASVPILVVDVNGDGLNDIIVGGSHEYGLDWWEQRLDNRQRSWVRHAIDPFNSQYHDMMWLDLDGDGECELLTGTRFRAHCGNDPGSTDPLQVCYFKWNGESLTKLMIDFGLPPEGAGLGIHFAVGDLTGNGLPDIVAPGKDGLHVFYNEGMG